MDHRARIEYFVQRKILKSCTIPYPTCSPAFWMYYMKRGSLQFDSSTKGKSKKMAYNVRAMSCVGS